MPRLQDPTYIRHVAPLLAMATRFLQAGQPADAIAPLRDAALLQPSNAAIWHDLGLAYLRGGDFDKAAIEVHPGTAMTVLNLK